MASDRMTTACQTDSWTTSSTSTDGFLFDNGQIDAGPYVGSVRSQEMGGFGFIDNDVNDTHYNQAYSMRNQNQSYRSQNDPNAGTPYFYFRDTGTRGWLYEGFKDRLKCRHRTFQSGQSAGSAFLQFSDLEDYQMGSAKFPTGILATPYTLSINVGFRPSAVFLISCGTDNSGYYNSISTALMNFGFLCDSGQCGLDLRGVNSQAPEYVTQTTTEFICDRPRVSTESDSVYQIRGALTGDGFDLTMEYWSDEGNTELPDTNWWYFALRDTRVSWGCKELIAPDVAGTRVEEMGGTPLFAMPWMVGSQVYGKNVEDWISVSTGAIDEAGNSRCTALANGSSFPSGGAGDFTIASNRAVRLCTEIPVSYGASMIPDSTTPVIEGVGYNFDWEIVGGGGGWRGVMPYAYIPAPDIPSLTLKEYRNKRFTRL